MTTLNDLPFPQIISVDDHVLEAPTMWTDRAPASQKANVPHVVRRKATSRLVDGNPVIEPSADEGEWCDWWIYGDKEIPLLTGYAAVGNQDADITPTTYEQVHEGCWIQERRLHDMDIDGLEASMCFPNVVPRFCGQTFLEHPDKQNALLCVQAYNDWILDEWCAGEGRGRLLPLTLVPLWDVKLAAAEARRCADRGAISVAFSENPYQLGLPTIHSGYWDELFATCAEADLVLTMHIGSSSHLPKTSPDAPHIISTCTHFSVTMGSILDFIFSGTLDRIPDLRLFYAESQAGWMPYVFEQADWLWARREGLTIGAPNPHPPTAYVKDRIFTSLYNDRTALRNRDFIGIDQIFWETDYPHTVASFPRSQEIAREQCVAEGLSDDEVVKVMRDNAIRAFRLDRVGLRTTTETQ